MRLSRWLVSLAILLLVAGLAFVVVRQQWAQEERDGALALARAGKFTEAEPALRRCGERDPQDVDVLQTLARGYLSEQKNPEAEEFLTRWLAERPADATALRLRLELYRSWKQRDKALADTERLLALEPNNRELQRQVAGRYFEVSRFADAEKACRAVLQQEPRDQSMRSLLAEAYRAQGQSARAAEILDQLLREDPQYTRAMVARGILYCEADQADQAIPLLQKVLALDPRRRGSARYYLSLALARAGRAEEAARLEAETRQAINDELLLEDSYVAPDNLELQTQAARVLLGRGESEKALKILQHVLARDPRYRAAHQLLAEHYERQGQAELAAAHRKQAGTAP